MKWEEGGSGERETEMVPWWEGGSLRVGFMFFQLWKPGCVPHCLSAMFLVSTRSSFTTWFSVKGIVWGSGEMAKWGSFYSTNVSLSLNSQNLPNSWAYSGRAGDLSTATGR